ncbi:MAG: hypothetical protein ABI726_03585 [bacterium]
MPSLGAGTRRVAAIALISIGCLFLLIGELAIYTERNLVDADRFADRAVGTLDDDATRDEVGVLVAEQLERANPDVVAFRAVIEAVVSGLAGTEPFQAALRTGIVEAHKAAFGKGEDSAAVTVANFGVLAEEALRAVSPEAAKAIPDGFRAELISFSEIGAGTDLIQIELGSIPIMAPILALLCLSLGVFAAGDRRAGLTGAALGVAATGALMVVGYAVGEALLAHAASDAGAEAASRSLWSALLADLRDWNLALCFAGAVIAGASTSLLRPADAAGGLRRLRAAFERSPRTATGRVLRALGLLAAGIFVFVSPDLAVRIVALAAGLALAFVGASELLDMVAGPIERRAETRERSAQALRWVLLGAVGVATAVAVLVVARGDDTGIGEGAASGCNGSEELCDRTLDEVVFPATHNSMAAADYPGLLFPMHDQTIPSQLDDGVRGLLIDAYYGFPGRRVYTDFARGPNKLSEQTDDELGRQFTAAADRLRMGIARPEGKSKPYLCHGFCELGAIDMVDTLREIDVFLDQHPNEVLVIVIEDYVTPADVVKAFEDSGLADRTYDGPLGPELPTLQELIDADRRVIVLAENRAGGAPWYRLAYDFFQETGYDFKAPSEMDCAPNRGVGDNPLFLINNWINTDPAAKPSNAAKVNAHDFLLDRAQRCASKRGLTPHLIAVDFYGEGDLLAVADELNGVP